MRLQKYLSKAGLCSRRKGEEYIKKGLVRVNGKIITQLGTRVDPDNDRVEAFGKHIKIIDNPVYIVLNKPKGYVSSCRHPGARVVTDLVKIEGYIYPVGRLDKDSSGLLLMTNDGRLHHRLSHPSFDHEKEYEVEVAKPMPQQALIQMEKGMLIMGSITRPALTQRLSSKRFSITLKEGRNRQIRRMVKMTDNKVIQLKRIRIAGIRLGRLAEGSWRYLAEKEKQDLFQKIKAPGHDYS